MAAVVALKCGVFATMCRSLPFGRAAILMLLANGATTLLGIALALGAAVPFLLLVVALPLVIWAAVRTASHLEKPAGVAAALVTLFIASFLLWGFSQAAGEGRTNVPAYWVLKFAYAACALTVSFVMTAAWEAHLLGGWALQRGPRRRARSAGRRIAEAVPDPVGADYRAASRHVLRAAFWANAAAFGLVATVGAAVALPTRLQAPDFLLHVAARLMRTLAELA
jgi:hypothetical protein